MDLGYNPLTYVMYEW